MVQTPWELQLVVWETEPTVTLKESPASQAPPIVKLETLLESTLVVTGVVIVTGQGLRPLH